MKRAIVVACLALGLFPRDSAADYFVEVLETMMESQAMDAQMIGRYVGIDPSSNLHFTYTLDTSARTFSYQLDPNSTYLGAAISVAGSGAFDASSGDYLWSSTGTAGSQTWVDSGVSHWTVLSAAAEEHDFMGDGMINGKTYKVTANCVVDGRKSTGNYQINVNGNVVLATGTDMIGQGTWLHSFTVGAGQDLPKGTMGTAKGSFVNITNGDFDLEIRAVPEPSGLVLCGIGLAAISAAGVRHRAPRRLPGKGRG